MTLTRFPGTRQRMVSLPKIRSGNRSDAYKTINTDSGTVTADNPDDQLNIVGGTGIEVTATPGSPDTITISSTVDWQHDEYAPIDAQITFILSAAPQDSDSVFFIINGIVYDDDDDYSVSGQTVTWTNAEFTMEVGDEVIIKYY